MSKWEEWKEAIGETRPWHLLDASKYVEDERKRLPQDSELQNIIDEIAQLIDSTIYKLKFLA